MTMNLETIKERLASLAERIDALSQRERLILFGLTGVILVGGWVQLVQMPVEKNKVALVKQQQEITKRMENANTLLADIMARAQPDTKKKQEGGKLEQQLQELQQRLEQATRDLVPPEQMGETLKTLLLDQNSLQLVKLETKPVEVLLNFNSGVIYRHTLEMTIKGDFFSVLSYLRQLENAPMRLFWQSIDYKVREHPQAQVTIKVFTLSFSDVWLGV